MSALECDIKLGLTSDGGRSNLTVSVKSVSKAPQLLARLVGGAGPGRPVACLPCNPFVPLARVAKKVVAIGVERHGDAFLVGPGDEGALTTLLVEMKAEAVLLGFGGMECAEQLQRAASPPWWRFAPSDQYLADLEVVMRYAASHRSLDVFGHRDDVLTFFDHARRLCGLPQAAPEPPG